MITGSITALVTPMLANSAVDWASLQQLVDWQIEQGTNAIVAVGTTGESPTLGVKEHLQVIGKIVEYVNGRIPVIAGTGANSTTEAVELTQSAKNLGADACLLVTPYYNKPTQKGLFEHFSYVAQQVAIPQILYNVPGRTAVDLLPETVLKLAEADNIVGIKEATGDLDRAKTLIDQCPSDFAVYSGDDATAVELILAGGKGNISVTSNVAPQLMSELCKTALSGDEQAARQLNQRLAPLHDQLFVEANPIPVKWALAELGRCQGYIRLPLTPLSEEWQAPLRAILADYR